MIGGEGAGPETCTIAESVGRALGRRGVTLLCGGRGGVMEAACRGAREEGGHTIGIMPGGSAAESPPNAYVEFPIYTGIGFARNPIVVLSGNAVIAVGGSYGTLSELAFAMIHGVPVIGIDTWDFAYHGHQSERIVRMTDPEAAVDAAIEMANAGRGTPSHGR